MKKSLVMGIVVLCFVSSALAVQKEKNKELGQEKIIAFTFIGKHDILSNNKSNIKNFHNILSVIFNG